MSDVIRLLVLDVDGVMTDGGIALDDRGVETKRFHVRDGTGVRMWQRAGHQVALITGRSGQAVLHRAAELDVAQVIQGTYDKGAALEDLLGTLGLTAEQTAFLGDDLPDLPIMKRAGYPMAVADAVDEIRALARYVTTRPGGQGAVREAIEHLLKASDQWDQAVSHFDR